MVPAWRSLLLLGLLPAGGGCDAPRPAGPDSGPDAAPHERVLALPEVDLRLLEVGPADGPAVLLLHGGRFSAATWQELGTLELLARAGYRALAPDLPGRGGTPAVEVDDEQLVARILDALGVERAALVSASYSGRFALPFTARSSERVRGLVALAPVGIGAWMEELTGSEVPVLAVWGERDATVPPEQGRALVAAVERGTFHLLPGAGHAGYLEQPATFHELLLAFLAELP